MVVTTLAVAFGATVLGVPYALLWALAAPDIPLMKVDDSHVVPTDPAPEQFVAGDGWFVLLGVGFGVAAALAAWFLARRTRGPVVLVALAAGLVMAGLVAAWLGQQIGLDDYRHALAAGAPGARLAHPPDLRVVELPWPVGVPLVAAFAAVATYTVMAGWSRHDSLRSGPSSQIEIEAPGQTSAVSWGWSAPPGPPAAPAPPESGEAGSPRD
jgi:hypothetical protein